jgi:hypothetical protein
VRGLCVILKSLSSLFKNVNPVTKKGASMFVVCSWAWVPAIDKKLSTERIA